MRHEFDTPRPISLYAEMGPGTLTINAADTTTTVVDVDGPHAEEFRVEQEGNQISIHAPRQRAGFFGGGDVGRADVTVVVPLGTDLAIRTGSASVDTNGCFGTCSLRSGSGPVRLSEAEGPAVVETGSGSASVATAHTDLRIKSGSGSVEVGQVGGSTGVSTGSGAVRIGSTAATAVVKTGSGGLVVDQAGADLSVTTGSGDIAVGALSRGRFAAKAGSGDVTVGIPGGVPVWTDIRSASGLIRSNLAGAGQPAEGQEHLEVRATTASGDITLHQL